MHQTTGKVSIWQAADGTLVQALDGPDDEISWVTWHSRGDLVLAGSIDYSCWLWNATSGKCMHVFAGHSGPVTCGGFSADGRLVVTGSADGSIEVWSGKTAECTATIAGHPFHEAGMCGGGGVCLVRCGGMWWDVVGCGGMWWDIYVQVYTPPVVYYPQG